MDYDDLIASRATETVSPVGPRQVIGWVSYASVEQKTLTDIGGWGGFMTGTDRWEDYVANGDERYRPHVEALRSAVITRGLRRGGDWHQSAADGVPVFDDGAVGTFSFRAWGDLLAAIWSGEDGRGYGYMDFYMDSCVEDAGLTLSPAR